MEFCGGYIKGEYGGNISFLRTFKTKKVRSWVSMYSYDSMLLILKGYRRIGEHIDRLTGELQVYKGGYKPKKQDISMYVKGGKHQDLANYIVDIERLQERIALLYSKHKIIWPIVEQFRNDLDSCIAIKAKMYILDMCYFMEKVDSRKNRKYIPIFLEWANCNNIVIPDPYEFV